MTVKSVDNVDTLLSDVIILVFILSTGNEKLPDSIRRTGMCRLKEHGD